jgi:integrase
VGNWLSLRHAQALLNAPDVRTKKGLRDRAMFAALLDCGLRRSELANLTVRHVQQRDNRWCIVGLVGKHGRVRTIPMPTWVKNANDPNESAPCSKAGCFTPIGSVGQYCGSTSFDDQVLKTTFGCQKIEMRSWKFPLARTGGHSWRGSHENT